MPIALMIKVFVAIVVSLDSQQEACSETRNVRSESLIARNHYDTQEVGLQRVGECGNGCARIRVYFA